MKHKTTRLSFIYKYNTYIKNKFSLVFTEKKNLPIFYMLISYFNYRFIDYAYYMTWDMWTVERQSEETLILFK